MGQDTAQFINLPIEAPDQQTRPRGRSEASPGTRGKGIPVIRFTNGRTDTGPHYAHSSPGSLRRALAQAWLDRNIIFLHVFHVLVHAKPILYYKCVTIQRLWICLM